MSSHEENVSRFDSAVSCQAGNVCNAPVVPAPGSLWARALALWSAELAPRRQPSVAHPVRSEKVRDLTAGRIDRDLGDRGLAFLAALPRSIPTGAHASVGL